MIFEYSDYKAYLRATLATFPKKGRGQINRIAQFLGVHPTLVSQVLNDGRDFSTEQVYKLCEFLGLLPQETDFMILLLHHTRAGTVDLKKYYKKKIEEARQMSLQVRSLLPESHALSETDRAILYSSWLYLGIWLFLSVDDGQTLNAVVERFAISRSQAIEILSFLQKVNLCHEEHGRFQMRSQLIHLEFGSPFLARHHTNWRLKSLSRIENLSAEELMFTSPFSVSKKDFAVIREHLMRVIKATSTVIKDSPAEDLACMNMELFWVEGS